MRETAANRVAGEEKRAKPKRRIMKVKTKNLVGTKRPLINIRNK